MGSTLLSASIKTSLAYLTFRISLLTWSVYIPPMSQLLSSSYEFIFTLCFSGQATPLKTSTLTFNVTKIYVQAAQSLVREDCHQGVGTYPRPPNSWYSDHRLARPDLRTWILVLSLLSPLCWDIRVQGQTTQFSHTPSCKAKPQHSSVWTFCINCDEFMTKRRAHRLQLPFRNIWPPYLTLWRNILMVKYSLPQSSRPASFMNEIESYTSVWTCQAWEVWSAWKSIWDVGSIFIRSFP